jgi:hypothetical protein
VDIIRSQRTDGVEVSLDPDALEDGLDQAALRARFEQQQEAARRGNYADVSDVMAEEMRKRQGKRKGGAGTDSKNKKQKDFKF